MHVCFIERGSSCLLEAKEVTLVLVIMACLSKSPEQIILAYQKARLHVYAVEHMTNIYARGQYSASCHAS